MNDPWTTSYRGLSIVPTATGDADAGYAASYKVNRTSADGSPETVARGTCDARYDSPEKAAEAAGDAARTAVDRMLDDAARST